MAAERWFNDGGVARRVKQRWINDGGTLRRVKERWVNNGGTARCTFREAGDPMVYVGTISVAEADAAILSYQSDGDFYVPNYPTLTENPAVPARWIDPPAGMDQYEIRGTRTSWNGLSGDIFKNFNGTNSPGPTSYVNLGSNERAVESNRALGNGPGTTTAIVFQEIRRVADGVVVASGSVTLSSSV